MDAAPAAPPPPLQPQHDTDLKRRYLSLLPPTQIIDICLSFEAYAPFHVRSQIWPPDLNVSIAALSLAASRPNPTNADPAETPIMDSLSDAPPPQPHPPPPPLDTGQSAPSDSVSRAPSQQPTASAPSSPVKQNTPVPVVHHPTPPPPPPLPPTPQYQPYQFASVQPAYPHAPYYQASGYYPPPPSYFPPPQQPPQPQLQPSTAQPAANGVSPPPPHPPDAQPTNASTEDLPSYEEMIVEALQECNDPDGMVPKNIFSRMQARYPLHTNFRPSASQALQKAYKRGRLLKNEDEGDKRYKLNPNWGGGSTSKRTTRRPQTQAQSLHAAPSPPPPRTTSFIQASPIHLRHPPPTSFTEHHPHHHLQQQPQPHTVSLPPNSTVVAGDTGDAWQAAQNILKAINFEELLNAPQSSQSQSQTDDSQQNQTSLISSVLQVQLPPPPILHHHHQQQQHDPSHPHNELVQVRAELQAHLALLTAQLFEIVKEDEEKENEKEKEKNDDRLTVVVDMEDVVSSGTSTATSMTTTEPLPPPAPPEEQGEEGLLPSVEVSNKLDTKSESVVVRKEEEEEEDEDEDMEEVVV